ncbi:pirin-like protein [Quercus suber]|uniref:pirin-like protein n=1 Tax=Quercus suber TaxID=58331 RepID=UPI000CE206C7|nr:pirin-like protein [Quercus suber]
MLQGSITHQDSAGHKDTIGPCDVQGENVSVQESSCERGSSKGKELVIDVDDLSPRTKRTRSPSGVFNPNKFRSYFTF